MADQLEAVDLEPESLGRVHGRVAQRLGLLLVRQVGIRASWIPGGKVAPTRGRSTRRRAS